MKTYTDSQWLGKSQVIEANGCFAISFFRPTLGSTNVWVSGVPIEAGNTLCISQNVGDADHSLYDIVFESGGEITEPNLYVIKLMPITTANG